jgi:hypothetical protein
LIPPDGISRISESETDKILGSFPDSRLKDWEIEFRIIDGNGSSIKVFIKSPSQVKDKLKQITVHIPIPTNEVVPWEFLQRNMLITVSIQMKRKMHCC